MKRISLLLVLACLCFLIVQGREKIRINDDWKYAVGDVAGASTSTFDDTNWQTVQLPHDASIYGAFIQEGQGANKNNGFRPRNKGWYRKHITFNPAWNNKRIILEFEGVYRMATVYINGTVCGAPHPNGYIDFEFDITDKLHAGENIIAVSYDNTYMGSSRWYTGEGINRDVYLHIVDDLHVDRYGTYITTPVIDKQRALVSIRTDVKNCSNDSLMCKLVTDICDEQGKVVVSRTSVVPFDRHDTYSFNQEMNIINPHRWEVGKAYLYTAISKVYKNDELVDTYETPFGVRSIEFTPEEGLLVNGQKVFLYGVCLHTDLGPLGTVSLERAWDKRLEVITRELGCNAIRTTHNPYPKYVLDWCDRHGILVMDEFFDKWMESFYGQGATFGEHLINDIHVQMRRDWNHPSVFLWSVGNEVQDQYQKTRLLDGGVAKLRKLVEVTHQFDPSRKVTVGQYPARYDAINYQDPNYYKGSLPNQFAFNADIMSVNYMEGFFARDKEKFPQLIYIVSEMATGELGYNFYSYDHSYACGQFYWGGTEYIGESFGWPSKGWINGLVDLSNNLKPIGYSVKSFYNPEPMVKIAIADESKKGQKDWNDLKITWKPFNMHWNFNEGEPLKVQVFTNCDETELFVNGKSQGKKTLPAKRPELVWDVNYEAGEIKAIGYRNGKAIAEDILKTAEKPAKLIVEPDVTSLKANGLDVAYFNVRLVDKHGTLVPNADTRIDFKVTGSGVNAGVDNGNILSDEPWQADYRTTYNGRCQLVVRSTSQPGSVKVQVKAKGLRPVTLTLPVR